MTILASCGQSDNGQDSNLIEVKVKPFDFQLGYSDISHTETIIFCEIISVIKGDSIKKGDTIAFYKDEYGVYVMGEEYTLLLTKKWRGEHQISSDSMKSWVKKCFIYHLADTLTGINKTIAVRKDTLDTIYSYNGNLMMQIKHGNKVIETKTFEHATDTLYYDNGKPRHIIVGRSSDFDSKHYEYYKNGQLQSVREQGTVFACGNQIGEELNYDSLGHLLSKSTFKHNLPKDANGCHETHTVTSTTEFYLNGKIRLKKQQENFYESDVCDCGIWEYYDEQGKLIKKEKHENCNDDSLSCAQ